MTKADQRINKSKRRYAVIVQDRVCRQHAKRFALLCSGVALLRPISMVIVCYNCKVQ
jgi:hypothetical protein